MESWHREVEISKTRARGGNTKDVGGGQGGITGGACGQKGKHYSSKLADRILKAVRRRVGC